MKTKGEESGREEETSSSVEAKEGRGAMNAGEKNVKPGSLFVRGEKKEWCGVERSSF